MHPDPPAIDDGDVIVYSGDCMNVMPELESESVDAVICDPPYALSFMSRGWDTHASPAEFQAWCEDWAREALRVLKPGGHLAAFGGTRTSHRLAAGIEDAGFEIRDTLAWLYGSGFPKSLDVSKAIDKAAGAQREVVGPSARHVSGKPEQRTAGLNGSGTFAESVGMGANITAPATPDAEQWQGWGTALKPAHEPVTLARKPLAGTVAANVLQHGTGALHIDACRIASDYTGPRDGEATADTRYAENGATNFAATPGPRGGAPEGRWPANVILGHHPECGTGDECAAGLDHIWKRTGTGDVCLRCGLERTYQEHDERACHPDCAAAMLDQQTGDLPGHPIRNHKVRKGGSVFGGGDSTATAARIQGGGHGDKGGASRFFYTAKAASSERNDGLHDLPAPSGGVANVSAQRTRVCRVCGSRTAAPGAGGRWPDCEHDNWTWEAKTFTARAANTHPTVKPVDLMRWLIRLLAPPGALILDPFAGSGTTGVAARRESVRCILIEREPEYLPIIAGRLSQQALL